MPKAIWTPWHKVVALREDLKTGELSLATFAADLDDVAQRRGRRPVYENAEDFFALTYPTHNLRELAKDVCLRLAAKNTKAVRQLELTYGGGKTHTLVTLFHLVQDPDHLPTMPAVQEFIQHIGMKPPKARVAALSFDKLDVEKGMEVRSPDGELRWLRQPWSVLAFQIAGSAGLKFLHAEGKDKERDSAPAENLLIELLSMPQREKLATLVLIDEVLMYAREKVGLESAWRDRLINFFQYLTQAATKVDRCCVVASLLATDVNKNDELGKSLIKDLYDIFRREREEGVQPVLKEDVAEVLRRRFFTPESVKDASTFKSHVVAALQGIKDLDDQTKREGPIAEERFLKSYPFHPDLTELFYAKWTQMEGFQRTRGVLRTFALGLREAARWGDLSPLVGAGAFLCEPLQAKISEGARELTTIAATEEYEGKRQEWTGILEGELRKAQDIQAEFPALKHRELEQAVLATFLHSQPIGQRAHTRDLFVLLGATRPDKIELEKALQKWADVSWFLDEGDIAGADKDKDGKRALPKAWRLGSKPNLRQMHSDAVKRVAAEPVAIETALIDQISRLKSLVQGASAMGVRVHTLPTKPNEVEDDGEFHFAILGPKAASDPGSPSSEAKRFLDETTGTEKPRVNRNAVVLAVASKGGLDAARSQIVAYIAWDAVRDHLVKEKAIDPIREALLAGYIDEAKRAIPLVIRQAYCIVVTVSEKNEAQAFRLQGTGDALFSLIKSDQRSRIQETRISADALLPEGPYNLWKPGETSRWAKDLVGAFAQFPHLPKMLNRKAILDTLVAGCQDGLFVLQLRRPDRSMRSFWRTTPDETALKDPGLEIVLPEAAELHDLAYAQILPGALPELWKGSQLAIKDLLAYFAGGKVVKVPKDRYEEPFTIPRAGREVLFQTVRQAVQGAGLWLTNGPATLLGEEIPEGILTEDAILHPPPKPVSAHQLLPPNLPGAWEGERTNVKALDVALSNKVGQNLPWRVVYTAVDGGIRSRMFLIAEDSAPWPCDPGNAQNVRIKIPGEMPPPPPPPPPTPAGVQIAEAEVHTHEIQELSELLGDLKKAAAEHDLRFRLRVELGDGKRSVGDVVERVQAVLSKVSAALRFRNS